MNSIDFKVLPTQNIHQQYAKKDYLIVVNSKIKKKLNIGQFAVVKYLFINSIVNEAITLTSIGRVIIDDELKEDTLCLSQTLRQAIGIPVSVTDGLKIKIERLNIGFLKERLKLFSSSQYIIVRVQKSVPQDIEKNFCRLSSDSISIVGSKSGQKLLFETSYSELIEDLKSALTEDKIINLKHIEFKLSNIFLDDKFYHLIPNIISLSQGNELINLVKCAYENKHLKTEIYNLIEIITWQVSQHWLLHNKSLMVFETNSDSIENISEAQKEQTSLSFFQRYPDFNNIFNVSNDLDKIYLDAYSRSLLKTELLKGLRVRRDVLNIVKNEIVEFGVVFIITIFTTIDAINGDNIRFLPYSIGIAIFYLIAIIVIRGR
jgi:hypothetical protein